MSHFVMFKRSCRVQSFFHSKVANYEMIKVDRTVWGNQRASKDSVNFLLILCLLCVAQIIVTKSEWLQNHQRSLLWFVSLLCAFLFKFDSFAVGYDMYHIISFLCLSKGCEEAILSIEWVYIYSSSNNQWFLYHVTNPFDSSEISQTNPYFLERNKIRIREIW